MKHTLTARLELHQSICDISNWSLAVLCQFPNFFSFYNKVHWLVQKFIQLYIDLVVHWYVLLVLWVGNTEYMSHDISEYWSPTVLQQSFESNFGLS